MKTFYNPCITLRMRTKRGGYPLVTYNVSHIRGPGKTFGWTQLISDYVLDHPTMKGFEEEERKLFEEYFASGQKFLLLTRKRGALGHEFTGIFKKSVPVCHPYITGMREKEAVKGVYSKCYFEYLEDENDINTKVSKHVGYVCALAASDDVKRVSSEMTDVGIIFFDEFQPKRKYTYLPDEYQCFKDIYDSVNRGGDNETGLRHVPVVMCSNTIDLFNPYFNKTGLWRKIQKNTFTYLGDNYIFHRVERPDIEEERKKEGLDSVFSEDLEEEKDIIWFNDNGACVCSHIEDGGTPMYDCTLVAGNRKYGVKYYPDAGVYFIDNKPDLTHDMVFNLYKEDMKPNIPAFKRSMRMNRLMNAMLDGICYFKSETIKADCMVVMLGKSAA